MRLVYAVNFVAMFSYFYQILGGVLIFVSSWVGEEMPPTKKKRYYILFCVLALLYSGFGILLDRHASSEQGKLQQTILGLRESFDKSESARKSERDAAEKARQSDRDAFLRQLGNLGNQLSMLRANVQTESLRKQLDETQRSLHETQQALEKHEVKLTFVVNGQVNPSEVSISRQRPFPNSDLEEYVVAFALLNNSDEDAGSGNAEISIVCTNCGVRFVGVDPWPVWTDHGVVRDFLAVSMHSALNLGRLALTPSEPLPNHLQLALRYRCLQCVPEEWRFVTLNLVSKER